MDHIQNRIVNEPKDFTRRSRDFGGTFVDRLQRLTYEVTEIALDRPGINLEF